MRWRQPVGVAEQVVEYLREPVPVGQDGEVARGRLPVEPAGGTGPMQTVDGGDDRLADVDVLQPQIEGVSLDPRHVEHVTHQAGETPGLARHGHQLGAGVAGQVLAGGQAGASRQQAAQRGTQLVRHVGEEVAADAVGLLQDLDLLLHLGEPHRQGRRLGLLTVEPGKLLVDRLQPGGERLALQLGAAPA